MEPVSPHRRRKILLVDDSATARSLVRVFLMNLAVEFEFIEAASADEALHWLADSDLALVIADYNMPGMDGISFVKRIRAHPSAREVPVVLLTAAKEADVRAQALDAGVTEFVPKPVTNSELGDAVRRALKR